jgi:nodulation protein E
MHRVVVTGIGCVSALGNTVPAFLDGLREGRSGIAEVTLAPIEKLNARMAAEVKGFDPAEHIDRRKLATLDRFSQFALVAAGEAVRDAGVEIDEALGRETAVVIGTGVGGMTTMDENYHRLYAENATRLPPFTIPKLMANAATSHISMTFGITGPAWSIASACSSSNHAIGTAFAMVRSGQCEMAITGGAEATITFGVLKGWEALRVMAPDTCRPFSRDRRGMVLGEGAGIVILESLDRARARGAHIWGEIAGFGMSSDAGDLVAPSVDGAARAILGALKDARLDPEGVQYVNAHGTGTPANDPTETKAIRTAFGAHADRLAVSSTKSMHGHALGAAGALELIAVLGALRHGVVPPTANFTEPDPECDLDYVPNTARRMSVEAALSNGFAFGGLNAVLALRRFA